MCYWKKFLPHSKRLQHMKNNPCLKCKGTNEGKPCYINSTDISKVRK